MTFAGRLWALAYKVANILGKGFAEHVYRNALAFELGLLRIEAKVEWPIAVYYREHLVGSFRADIFVANSLLIEVKACTEITPVHIAQCLNYLKASEMSLCQLINFSPTGVQPKRLVNNF